MRINMPGLVASLRARDALATNGVEVSGSTDVSAAAWLLWRNRKMIHRYGVASFNIPAKVPAPRWFLVAMDVFQRRAGWRVISLVKGGKRIFKVFWENHHRYKRGTS